MACKRSRVRASYSPPNKNRLKLMFEAVFCKRARVGLFFLDKQWTNKIAIYNDCKPLFSDRYKLCVDNFSVRIVVYDGLVARLDTVPSSNTTMVPTLPIRVISLNGNGEIGRIVLSMTISGASPMLIIMKGILCVTITPRKTSPTT